MSGVLKISLESGYHLPVNTDYMYKCLQHLLDNLHNECPSGLQNKMDFHIRYELTPSIVKNHSQSVPPSPPLQQSVPVNTESSQHFSEDETQHVVSFMQQKFVSNPGQHVVFKKTKNDPSDDVYCYQIYATYCKTKKLKCLGKQALKKVLVSLGFPISSMVVPINNKTTTRDVLEGYTIKPTNHNSPQPPNEHQTTHKPSRYEKYKDTIKACQKRWLQNPQNRKKRYIAEKERTKRKKVQDAAIIAKYQKLKESGLIPSEDKISS